MKKYKQSDELQKFIDWENIMKMPRYAGGHDQQMIGLFKNSELIGHHNDNDYQGMVATCVKLNDKYIIYNDYYGSCSGCDSWENASNEEVKSMCIGLANSAYIFESLMDVKYFLNNPKTNGNWNWNEEISNNLLKEINNKS